MQVIPNGTYNYRSLALPSPEPASVVKREWATTAWGLEDLDKLVNGELRLLVQMDH